MKKKFELETSLKMIDCLDFINFRGKDKHGSFSRVISKKLFLEFILPKVTEDPNIELDDIIVRPHIESILRKR